MNPRDVIYVLTDPGVPAFGRKGASSHVQSVLRELTRRVRAVGGSVTLVATRIDGEVPAGLEDMRVIELGRPQAKDPAVREQMLVDLDQRAARIVTDLLHQSPHAEQTLVYQRYALWSAQVMEAAAAAGARTVMEVNAPLIEEQATHRVLVDRVGATAMTVRALQAAHVVYGVSGPVAQWAQQVASLPSGSVQAIPNGVDVQRFSRALDAREERRTGRQGDPVTIVFVGTFRPWHAPDMLVAAAADLAAQGHHLRLLLVGEGPMLSETIGQAVAAQVEVESTGSVPPDEVPGLLAQADIAVAPYPAGQAYFSPLKVAEYLAAGLPTVASAVADLPTLFRADEVALVTPGSSTEFTDALRLLVEDPDARAALAHCGHRAATQRCSWTAVVDRVLQCTGEVAA